MQEVTITNHEVSWNAWETFTREQLRAIAKQHGIKRGRNKQDLIFNLLRGNANPPGPTVTFKIKLGIVSA